ncbi:hypothetical protein ACOSQ3_000979 [Xanthoceras sorbifolium]
MWDESIDQIGLDLISIDTNEARRRTRQLKMTWWVRDVIIRKSRGNSRAYPFGNFRSSGSQIPVNKAIGESLRYEFEN